MTAEPRAGEQEPLHYNEWQKARFFFQLLARLCLCPLLQRQPETADIYIIAAPSAGKILLEMFPCCHRVVQWIVSCKSACACGNWDSPSFLKAESLGEVFLKWEQDHLPPLVCDLFRQKLWFSIQNNFLVSKVLSLWIEMNSLLCMLNVQMLILFLCVWEILLHCHGLFCGTELLICDLHVQ